MDKNTQKLSMLLAVSGIIFMLSPPTVSAGITMSQIQALDEQVVCDPENGVTENCITPPAPEPEPDPGATDGGDTAS